MCATDAVIFDLDGTLIDIESVYLDAHAQILSEYGVSYGKAEHRQFLRGKPQQSGKKLIEQTPLTLDEFNDRRHVLVRQNAHLAPDLPGVPEFITQLSESNCRLGLATNSPTFDCQQKLAPRAWSNSFQEVICGDHPEVKETKPSPDIYLVSALKLGVEAENCIVFEDSPFGIEAALAAGMRVIAIRSEFVGRSVLQQAEYVIDDFSKPAELMRLCGL